MLKYVEHMRITLLFKVNQVQGNFMATLLCVK